jgi:hypothetical protein
MHNTIASALDHAKQDKQNEMAAAAYEATASTNKNHRAREK